jgi:hypothetical protein
MLPLAVLSSQREIMFVDVVDEHDLSDNSDQIARPDQMRCHRNHQGCLQRGSRTVGEGGKAGQLQ